METKNLLKDFALSARSQFPREAIIVKFVEFALSSMTIIAHG